MTRVNYWINIYFRTVVKLRKTA